MLKLYFWLSIGFVGWWYQGSIKTKRSCESPLQVDISELIHFWKAKNIKGTMPTWKSGDKVFFASLHCNPEAKTPPIMSKLWEHLAHKTLNPKNFREKCFKLSTFIFFENYLKNVTLTTFFVFKSNFVGGGLNKIWK